MDDLERFGHFVPRDFLTAEDAYPWVTGEPINATYRIDRWGMRAMLAVWRLLTRSERATLRTGDNGRSAAVIAEQHSMKFAANGQDLLKEISFWMDAEFEVDENVLTLVSREQVNGSD